MAPETGELRRIQTNGSSPYDGPINEVKMAQPYGFRPSGAAQESNLPTDGLHRPAGFEGRKGLALQAAPRGVCALNSALAEGSAV